MMETLGTLVDIAKIVVFPVFVYLLVKNLRDRRN